MDQAPDGSRVQWAEKTDSKLQSAPGFSGYAKDERTWDLIEGLFKVAEETGRSVAQVSLRWLLEQNGVPSVVIGARTLQQLEDNMGAATFRLTAEQTAELTRLSDVPVPCTPDRTLHTLVAHPRCTPPLHTSLHTLHPPGRGVSSCHS